MTELFFKEFRQLRPIAYLWLALSALGFIAAGVGSRIDETSFASWCGDYCLPGTDYVSASVLLVMFLIFAYSLFPREHDDSTIDFLHALPVSRRTIFLVKFLSAWFLIIGLIALTHIMEIVVLSFNSQSIDGRDYPVVKYTMLLREALFAFVILSHGIFLSRFRTPGLILYALYLIVLIWVDSRYGDTGAFNVMQMLHNEYQGQTLLLHWEVIVPHLLVAIFLLVIAYFSWNKYDSRNTVDKSEKTGFSWSSLLLTIVFFVFLTGMMIARFKSEGSEHPSEDISKSTTTFYRYTYPVSRESTVQYIMRHADDDYKAMQSLLQASHTPTIQADLAAQSKHAIGLAKWKKIKVDLSGFSDDIFYRRVVSHETAHVFQSLESNLALAKNAAAVQFFVEGMAQYASFSIVEDKHDRELNWHLAAVAWDRQEITFKKMLASRSFVQEHYMELYYTLGDIWTWSLVDSCGEKALGDILRAAGREGAPQNMSAELFWRDILQQVSCNLESVNAVMDEKMTELLTEKGDARFPMLTEVSSQFDQSLDRIRVSARIKFPDSKIIEKNIPNRFYLRTRNSSQSTEFGNDSLYTGKLENNSVDGFRVNYLLPRTVVENGRYDFQLGFLPQVGSRIYFQRWQTGNL